MTVKTFTNEQLTAADVNVFLANAGLVYVSSTTVGSGVTSVTVSNCFSSTYNNYRLVFSNITGTVSNSPWQIQFNNSTGSTYKSTSAYLVYGSTGFYAYAPSTTTVARVGWSDTTSDMNLVVDIISPNLSAMTTWSSQGANQTITYQSAGIDTNAAAQTGFTMTGDTFTGGLILCYGYRKA